MAWNFWEANCADEKERKQLERDMYEPLTPLPFAPEQRVDFDGWSLTPWKPGERGVVAGG